MIALVGFMGAGKSTVGRVLAERMDLPFIDADEVIESRAGKPIAAIFEDDGEDVFRRLEADVVQQALTGGDVVIALGGGALGDENTREALAGAMVVYLDVDLEEALKRVGDDARRPKLGSVDLKALLSERVPTYRAVADAIVTTTGRPLEEIADEVVVVVGEQQDGARDGKVRVELGDRSYDVTIGSALSGRIASYLPPEAEEIAVITHPTLEALAAPLIGALQSAGRSVHVITVPEGETSKSWAQAAGLLDRMASIPLHRKDVVIAFGGGVVGDLAGFVASTYARGLSLIQVPTSLLAQVDAAIGGKTAVNLEAGKNLAGTWHQPLAVFCDTKTLRSLPEAELRSGLAEVVKYGLI
ncbi:MAG: 3-dehydroquinate synthase, partial [Actinomycetota bacterium]|nr:3-dehydroquinate synthase [Actinomycetota bacterium]